MDIKLLVVEDEPRALARYRNYIELYKGGFEIVATASTYEEAIKAFNTCKIDCIFTDIIIPGGTGLDLLEYVRSKKWDGICVIISGYDKFSYAQKAIRLGALDYLLKPIFESTFFKMLDKVRLKMGIISPVTNKYYDQLLPRYIKKAMEYVEHNYDSEIQLSSAAEQASVSAAYLSSRFTKYLGITFIDFVKYYRVQVVKSLLEKSSIDCSLDEIADKTGFCDSSYLNHCFKKLQGVTPRKYQLDYHAKEKQNHQSSAT
ncbi:response regulator [Treponema parvum]|uniref:Response regulator n=1 Tax=Treponema parvum TaxID=138851 RepID=A0A975EXQ7_9SPIR|nr:response regulator [Treponema parvum]QTQ10939.1 response regulator [Treponema parvum]QTQ17115.1 response regulator [Treponema parvum]